MNQNPIPDSTLFKNVPAAANERFAALVNAVNAEEQGRQQGDADLASQIATKASQASLAAEAQTRANADTNLSNRIDQEATTRGNADDALRNSIDQISARTAGVNTRAVEVRHDYAGIELNAGDGTKNWRLQRTPSNELYLINNTAGASEQYLLHVDPITCAFDLQSPLRVKGRDVLAAIDGKEPALPAASSPWTVLGSNRSWQRRVVELTVADANFYAQNYPAFCHDAGSIRALDAYRLDGTRGTQLAEWRGDSTQGRWCIAGTGIAITDDPLTFARSLRANGYMSEASNYPMFATSRHVSLESGASGAARIQKWSDRGGTLETGTDDGALAQVCTLAFRAGDAIRYCAIVVDVNTAPSESNKFALFAGLISDDFANTHMGILGDPYNIVGDGALPNWSSVAKLDAAATVSPGSVAFGQGVGNLLEIVQLGSVLRVYRNGMQIGDPISTNVLPGGNAFSFVLRLMAATPAVGSAWLMWSRVYACAF